MAENKVRLLKICCCNRVSLGWEPGDLDFWLYLAMDELCDLGQVFPSLGLLQKQGWGEAG